MCGIFGIVGKEAPRAIKDSLCKLSYRGYDSAGYCILDKDFVYEKCAGHPDNLKIINPECKIGIGHNRWATHGAPTRKNAHPHISNDGSISVVHNGIIENYHELKNMLVNEGFCFNSETDTEVVPNLIQYMVTKKNMSFLNALSSLGSYIDGAYALAIITKQFPNSVFCVRFGSSLYIGKSKNAMYVCSDSSSMPFDTEKVLQMDDSTFAEISKHKAIFYDFKGHEFDKSFSDYNSSKEDYSLNDFPNYMKKEIFEQSIYSKNAIRGRVMRDEKTIKLSGIKDIEKDLIDAEEIIITGCGSALYAGSLAANFMSEILDKRVYAVPAGELKYSPIRNGKNKVLIAISQSGETADTLGCIKNMKNKGYTTCGIVNTPNSTIAREVDAGIYIRAGKEVSVASTKAVLNQIISLYSVALYISNKLSMNFEDYSKYINLMSSIPSYIEEVTYGFDDIEYLAKKLYKASNLLVFARGPMLNIAKEAALKIKEISYIHAESMSASELKHGPIALISKDMPSLFFVENNFMSKKIKSNIMEVKSRGGIVVVLCSNSLRSEFLEVSDYIYTIKKTGSKYFDSIKYLVFSQILAYHLCLLRGNSVDRPRNLAKSVTVE